MVKTVKSQYNKIFLRDVALTRKGFLYFLISIIFSLNSMFFVISKFLSVNPEIITDLGLTFIISTIISLSFAGLIVDKFKNRMILMLISSLGQIIGLIILFLSLISKIFEFIGLFIVIFFSGIYIVNFLSVLAHETTILNRGRILGYLFFPAFLLSFIIFTLINGNLVAVVIIEIVIYFILIHIYKQYSYIETDERLSSDLKFRETIVKQHIFGYLTTFLIFAFILGYAFPLETNLIDPLIFMILMLIFLIISGVLLDNLGRKLSFVGGILLLASIIIFSEIYKERNIYSTVYFGISIPIIIIALFTITGDFTTEWDVLKYRGRISAIFLLIFFIGVLTGISTKYILNQISLANQNLFWLPELILNLNSFLLIILLVRMIPLPDILSTKESDWAEALINLYVFNRDSICLFAKSFIAHQNSSELPSKDLVVGGLAGMLSLISEITNERKNLRYIDKDRIKLYFSYGENVIVALTSTSYLPILFKKLEIFTTTFEKKFENELENFSGNTHEFTMKTDKIISRYFK